MPVMSKTAKPLVFGVKNSTVLSTLSSVLCILMHHQNIEFWRQARYSIFWDILKQVEFRIHTYICLVVYSHQPKAGILFSKGEFNSNQEPNYLDEHDLSKWVDKNRMFARTVLKGLEQHSRPRCKIEPLGKRMRRLFEALGSLKLLSSDPLCPQMSPQMILQMNLKKVRILIMQAELVSILSQNINRKGFELSKCLGKEGVSLLKKFLKELQKGLADPGYTRKLWKNLCESPISYNTNLLGIQTKKPSDDLEQLSEASITPCYDKESSDSKFYRQNYQTRLLEICYACQEMVSKKKFFYERRFGILSKCGCIICYGCIRSSNFPLDRGVKGPIKCPSCSVKSDMVASSARFVDGEEKVNFFETYRKNTEFPNSIKMKFGWTSFRDRNDDICTAGQQWNR